MGKEGGGVIDRNGSIFQSPWEDAALGSAIHRTKQIECPPCAIL